MEHFDLGVSLAFIFTILSALLCVIYGLYNWNKDGVEQTDSMIEEWAHAEDEIEEEL